MNDLVSGRGGWLGRLKEGLVRSATVLGSGVNDIFTRRKLDRKAIEELEDLLITTDLGVETASRIIADIARNRFDQEISPIEVREQLARSISEIMDPVAVPLEIGVALKPHVVLLVGVNGTGKTTTAGKLAQQYARAERSVMLAAGDTFRAAAIQQLAVWGERVGVPVVRREAGADAAGVIYDAMERACVEQADILLIDTAGRLHNKADLMAELQKVIRVIRKIDETAPHSVLLVLDATTGQNALGQVEAFSRACGVTGLIMTKLDGTARGGVLVALAAKFGIPVHAIGVGEGVDDLQAFDASAFARALVGLER